MEFTQSEKIEIRRLLEEQDNELRLIRLKQYLSSRNSELAREGVDYTHLATQMVREYESKRPQHRRRSI